jgi:hypothetical protein
MKINILVVSVFVSGVMSLGYKCHNGVYDYHTPTTCGAVGGQTIRDSSDQYCCSFSVKQWANGDGIGFCDICNEEGMTCISC